MPLSPLKKLGSMQLIFKTYSNYDHIHYESLRIHFICIIFFIHFMQCKTTLLEIQSTTVFQKIYERETYICKYISFSNYDCYKILTFMPAYDLQSGASRTCDQTPHNMLNLWWSFIWHIAQHLVEGEAYHKLSSWIWHAFHFTSAQPHVMKAADLSFLH